MPSTLISITLNNTPPLNQPSASELLDDSQLSHHFVRICENAHLVSFSSAELRPVVKRTGIIASCPKLSNRLHYPPMRHFCPEPNQGSLDSRTIRKEDDLQEVSCLRAVSRPINRTLLGALSQPVVESRSGQVIRIDSSPEEA